MSALVLVVEHKGIMRAPSAAEGFVPSWGLRASPLSAPLCMMGEGDRGGWLFGYGWRQRKLTRAWILNGVFGHPIRPEDAAVHFRHREDCPVLVPLFRLVTLLQPCDQAPHASMPAISFPALFLSYSPPPTPTLAPHPPLETHTATECHIFNLHQLNDSLPPKESWTEPRRGAEL